MREILELKSVRSVAYVKNQTRAKMVNQCILSAIVLLLIQLAVIVVATDAECGDVSSSGRTLNLSVNSKRNQTGEWVTTFSAQKESNGTSNDINLDVTHKYTECNGKQFVRIQGVIKEIHGEFYKDDTLTFHPKCGTNALISNNGRSVEKINLDDELNGVAITYRPLKNNELFQIRLDKKNTKFNHAIGIGVTTHSPDKLEIPKHMNFLKTGTWMMYITNVYHNGSTLKSNYMKNLNELKVGDRVGVKRKENGHLHLFINGIDQGTAATNIPDPVYGVFELYNDAVKATIVDAN